MANRVISAIRGTARAIGETYRLGFRAWWAAPLIVAIAVLPQFIQHVAEIRMGMFGSLERFQALAQNPGRWMFGYAKVAGMIIAILAIARFWAVGSVRRAFAIPASDLGRLVLAILLVIAVSYPFSWLTARNLPVTIMVIVRVASMLVQAGLTLFIVAALLGDRALTLRSAFTQRWPTALVLAITVIVAAVPVQMIHMLNHRIAIEQPAAIVWVLMIWDSLLIGLLATLTGSALWAAYRSGATWRGWAPGFVPDPTVEAAAMPEGEAFLGVESAPQTVIEPPAPPPPPPPPPSSAHAAPKPAPAVEAPRRRRPRPGPRPRG